MSWEIKWHTKAYEKLEALPSHIRERVINCVDRVKENPFHFLEHFERKGFYKLRIGNYRALISLDFEKN
ncbi:MAG: type II toxin-antitoxin system RelE/ParE family toxin [Candidatus Aenigmatarchaeota archaeon]|nr:type II toxin-antitoxin system RelE/ParE family toxin [Candidatus Aenigmarchaeota archaeon]